MDQAQGRHRAWRRLKGWGRRRGTGLLRAAFTGTAFLSWLRRGRSWRPSGREIKSILLIRLDLLGDVLLTMPAVAALRQRYPQARMTMLVLPYCVPALELFPYVDRVLSFDINKLRPSGEMFNLAHYRDLWRLIVLLRRERYDLAIGFYGLSAAALALASGAALSLGYRGEACPLIYNMPVPGRRYILQQHEVEYNLALAVAAGALEPAAPLRANIPTSARERVEVLLAQSGVSPQGPLVVCHPGSSNGAAKRWPASGWSRLGDRLARDMGARVVLTGAASERSLGREVASRMASRPLNLVGMTSLAELAALLARCQVLVAGDTAPLHLAWALGTPAVALFGPTDPAIYGPYGGLSQVVRKEISCSPCYDLSGAAECSRGDLACMEAITPEEVYAAVERLLAAPAPAAPGIAP